MKSHLLQRGFVSLLVTQFLGAANDNILKQILIFMVTKGLWQNALGDGGQGYIALCMTIPFILLSGYAGRFADRRSKTQVALFVKIAEIPIAVTALVGLWVGNLWLTLVAFIALAVQSAFFGPAKYGMIPELVTEGELSRANGAINMLTNIAIIVGTLIAGPVCDAYFPQASQRSHDPLLWLPGVTLVLVALLGLGAALFLPRLEAKDPTTPYEWNPFGVYVDALKSMARGPLIWIALAWGYFYMIGMISILILPEYSVVLQIDFTKTSYLLGILAIAIGGGSAFAGLISGHRIEPRLTPIGAVGLTLFLVLLGVVPPSYWNVAAFVAGAGFFAGLYLVPLQALLQDLSPEKERGRFLGTANALSFLFSSIGAVVCWMALGPAGLPAPRGFLVAGVLSLLGTGVLLWRLRRFIAHAQGGDAERPAGDPG
ncbi:MAG: MFS transporter [Phycisphaerales bacterium]